MKQLLCRVCGRARFYAYHEQGNLLRFELTCTECGNKVG